MSRAVRFAPLVLLLAIVAALVWRLVTPADTNVHSMMEGKHVPYFPPMAAANARMMFSSADLARGQPTLVNFFASWCVPCIAESKTLAKLKAGGAPIFGIAVRDRFDEVDTFLQRNGDPYAAINADPQSEIQIGFGSSGVPETFVVDGKGIIRYQHIGPIDDSDVPMILSKLERAR